MPHVHGNDRGDDATRLRAGLRTLPALLDGPGANVDEAVEIIGAASRYGLARPQECILKLYDVVELLRRTFQSARDADPAGAREAVVIVYGERVRLEPAIDRLHERLDGAGADPESTATIIEAACRYCLGRPDAWAGNPSELTRLLDEMIALGDGAGPTGPAEADADAPDELDVLADLFNDVPPAERDAKLGEYIDLVQDSEGNGRPSRRVPRPRRPVD